MQINPILKAHNFGRAFSTKEKIQYKNLINDAKKQLGIKDTTAIIFDFNVPSKKGYNTAIGTTFSDSAKPFTRFLKDMTGISSIQMQPQGKIEKGNTSPYSGTNYAYGEHLIDLKKLTSSGYAFILSDNDVKEADENYKGDKGAREYRTDYSYVLGTDKEQGIQEKLLKKAFYNFNKAVNSGEQTAAKLNNEFEQFKNENSSWLEKNAMYEALSAEYGTRDFKSWSSEDKILYSSVTPDIKRKERINEIKKSQGELIEFENFKQFLADKQQKETREYLSSKGIKVYGDCLIGFSYGEMWSNIDCFNDNMYYGGPDPNCPETNCIQTWGLPALDYSKLGECSDDGDVSKLGKAGKLLYDKYQNFFKRYDGIRMDAAWQFVTPFVYRENNGNYEEVKFPDVNYTILNIMKAAADKASETTGRKVDNDNIMLELVGLSAGKSREMTLNKYPHLYTTAYAEYDECPAKFLEKGYQQGKFYAGVGCHDNDSLVNMAKDVDRSNMHYNGIRSNYNLDENKLKYDSVQYNSQSDEEKREENFRNAKFSEIFTSAKQFFTLPDMFGMSERINISGKSDKNNWSIRIPTDFEKFYHTQLSKGFGLNLPKVLANAMQMANKTDNNLLNKCLQAAEILRSDGPMTERDANLAESKGLLKSDFEYKI